MQKKSTCVRWLQWVASIVYCGAVFPMYLLMYIIVVLLTAVGAIILELHQFAHKTTDTIQSFSEKTVERLKR